MDYELPPMDADKTLRFALIPSCTRAGAIVPAGVPKPIVQKLNAETNKALAAPAVADRLPHLGLIVAGGTPEQFAAHIRKEAARRADVVKRSGARLD